MKPVVECLFHEDRTVFDKIEKELVSSKCVPKSYAHRLASAVCSCRKRKDEIPDKVSIHGACDIVSEEIIRQGLQQRWSPLLRNLISSCLEANGGNCSISHSKFLFVISKALKGDFSPLTREAINTNKEYINKLKPSEKIKKMTETEKRLVENKRKKKMISETINVPMFPGNFRTFESRFLGKPMAVYAKENKSYIQLVGSLNDSSMANNVNKTFITIWSKDSDRLKSVKEHLAKKARETQAREDSQHQMRKALKQQRKEERLLRPKLEEDEKMMEDNLFLQKDWKGENLERKIKKKSGSRSKAAGLLLGHCLQCKKPYTKPDTTSKCVHHPGYIMKQPYCQSCGVPEMMLDGVVSSCPHPVTMTTVWSCCGQPLEGQGHEEHVINGCTEVNQHNWRVNYSKSQRSNGCHGNKIPNTPCKFVRKRATKHRIFERKQKHMLSFKLL